MVVCDVRRYAMQCGSRLQYRLYRTRATADETRLAVEVFSLPGFDGSETRPACL